MFIDLEAFGQEQAWTERNAKLHNTGSEQWTNQLRALKRQYKLDTVNNRKTDKGLGGNRSCSFVLSSQILSKVAPEGVKELKFGSFCLMF